jgi:hypothetical protein
MLGRLLRWNRCPYGSGCSARLPLVLEPDSPPIGQLISWRVAARQLVLPGGLHCGCDHSGGGGRVLVAGYTFPRQERVYGQRTWLVHGVLWTAFHAVFYPWEQAVAKNRYGMAAGILTGPASGIRSPALQSRRHMTGV